MAMTRSRHLRPLRSVVLLAWLTACNARQQAHEAGGSAIGPSIDPEPPMPPGADVIEAMTRADIEAAIGQTVRVVGTPANTKASPGLKLADGGWIHCHIGGTHWPDAYSGHTIVVTGVVTQLAGPAYPVATRDEEGSWSQGVTAPPPLLSEAVDASDPFRAAEASGNGGVLTIQVTSHSRTP